MNGDDHATRRVAAARALIDAGNYRGAVDELKAALALEPDHGFAHGLLAACHLDMGDARAALEEAADALSRSSENLLAQQVLGLAHLRQKEFPQAEDALKRAVEIDPLASESHRLLGVLYDGQARFTEARAAFGEALRLDPENGAVIASYAEFLADKGELDAAEALTDATPDYLADHERMLLVRGKIALRRGDVERARDFALWVLRSDAEDRAAIALLCEAKARANPAMALWFGWANTLQRFDGKTRIVIVIGLWLGFKLLAATAMPSWPAPVQIGLSLAWIVLCLLTWIGPAVLGWMVQRELKTVRFKRDF